MCYVRRGASWVAASNSSLALAMLAFVRLDIEALMGFALTGNLDGTRSPFDDVHKIPHGHQALLVEGRIELKRYVVEELHPAGGTDDELIDEGSDILRSLVEAATSSHKEPATLELSGGLDSRGLLVAMTPGMRRATRMLTLGTPDHPDWITAADLGVRVGAEHLFVDLRGLDALGPEEAWSIVERSAFRHDASSGAVASGVLDWVEGQVPQGPRFNGINGEYARGRFYSGQRPGPTTQARVDRLVRWRVFANDAVEPWLFHPGVIESARSDTLRRLQDEFSTYGPDWLRATDDHFLYGRMQRWCGADFSAAGLDRPLLAPYFCAPFLVWARRLDPLQKRSSRLFSAVLERLDPELARVPLVTGLSPHDLAHPSTGTQMRQARRFVVTNRS